ncbi:hypothetical protein ILYODFUR_028259 [Ilyodon furcidens]|uniref:Uncharacterized protein n=1 Tax=Ilyodon furcidens TaxID=33524 RepID=A0ABV0U9H4_9TELE
MVGNQTLEGCVNGAHALPLPCVPCPRHVLFEVIPAETQEQKPSPVTPSFYPLLWLSPLSLTIFTSHPFLPHFVGRSLTTSSSSPSVSRVASLVLRAPPLLHMR